MNDGINPEILLEICRVEMPFGKYKGYILADIPVNYLEWLHKQGMPAGKLGMQLATIYEIKINGLMELLTPIRNETRQQASKNKTYRF